MLIIKMVYSGHMYQMVSPKKIFLACLFFGLHFQFVSAQTMTSSTNSVLLQDRQHVEQRVREYFKDTPVMIEIARCESKFRQFTDNGSVLRGGAGGGMVGVFQFYEQIHIAPALTLGFDLTTLEGNLGYARHLYNTSGTTPWQSAMACWNTPLVSTTETSNTQLKIELLKKLLVLLQQLLVLKQSQI